MVPGAPIFEPGAWWVQTTPLDQPIELLKVLRLAGHAPLFYCEQPHSGVTIAAAGSIVDFTASGAERFAQVSQDARATLLALDGNLGFAPPGHGPMVVGGFGFSPRCSTAPHWREFPPAWMFLPKLLWIRRGVQCTLTRIQRKGGQAHHAPADAELSKLRLVARGGEAPWGFDVALPDDLERRHWCARVERVRARIAAGELRKVVLSRATVVVGPAPFDPVAFLADARAQRPFCFNFAIRAGARWFVGSTPEQLVGLEQDRVKSGALAGSAPRGATPADDRRWGAALLASSKNREEHELVVDAIMAGLRTVATQVSHPPTPRLLRLPEIQHLFTPIDGRIQAPCTVIEIAGLLHPTPAVCGVPRDAASAIIEREEPERGWYTGALGWMNGGGEGEFAVALRSGLIEDRTLFLWAGAGIVADSDPGAEWLETAAKMTALGGRFATNA